MSEVVWAKSLSSASSNPNKTGKDEMIISERIKQIQLEQQRLDDLHRRVDRRLASIDLIGQKLDRLQKRLDEQRELASQLLGDDDE